MSSISLQKESSNLICFIQYLICDNFIYVMQTAKPVPSWIFKLPLILIRMQICIIFLWYILKIRKKINMAAGSNLEFLIDNNFNSVADSVWFPSA